MTPERLQIGYNLERKIIAFKEEIHRVENGKICFYAEMNSSKSYIVGPNINFGNYLPDPAPIKVGYLKNLRKELALLEKLFSEL